MEVTFNGTYDKEMFIEAMRLTERQTVLGKVFRYLALGLAILVIGGSLYAWFTEGMDSADLPRLARNIITALIIGYYYFSNILSRRSLLAKLFDSTPKRTMQGNASVAGIAIGPDAGKTLFKWEQFTSKGERGNIYALLTTDGSVAVFHKDFFTDETDWQRFKQMANQRVIEPK